MLSEVVFRMYECLHGLLFVLWPGCSCQVRPDGASYSLERETSVWS